MNNSAQIGRKRIRIMMGLLIFSLVVLIGRLAYLQVWAYSTYALKNNDQIEEVRVLQSPRGTIYDRNGTPLAVSVVTKTLYADPKMLNKSPEEVAELIGSYLDISKETLVERLKQDTSFVYLNRMMDKPKSDAVAQIIKTNELEGLAFIEESKRYYPNGALAAQVLGFVGTDDKGLDGLEMVLDKEIKGDKMRRLIRTDRRGNAIFDGVTLPPLAKEERNVRLTIDTTIQFMAERALDKVMSETKAQGASVIIMDPKSGEILAMANRPTYDPNRFAKGSEGEFKNRAVINLYEPGSTFKPIIASAALMSGRWSVDTVFNDTGAVMASGHAIKNWNDEGYGQVRLLEILKYSINTGMAKIGLTVGPELLMKYVKDFGFGKATGINLPGEGDGILFNVKDMRDIDTASMSIGQGIAVTPLQMVQAFSAFANGGKMMRPHILASINNPDGSTYQTYDDSEAGQPISPEVAAAISDILEKEVSEGGGNKAMVEGYRFAGKTGTAEKLDTERGGYLKGRYIASFIGYGPVEDARFVTLIVIDDPKGTYYGGQIAAPVFKDLMSQLVRYYQISPSITKQGAIPTAREHTLPKIAHTADGEVIMPDFTGWTLGEVRDWLHQAELGFKPDGTGYAIGQTPSRGIPVKAGEAVTVYFKR